MNMNRVVIIGSPGAGKTTLARDLGRILNINVVHLDRVFWEPGWKKKPRGTRIDILQEIVRIKDQWIIEGTYLGSSKPRLEAADTIIFLDTLALVCLCRIFKRHFSQGEVYRAIPEGCHDKLNLIPILKVLAFPVRGKRTLKQNLPYYESMSKEIIWLHSKDEVEAFLAQLEAQTNEKNNSSRIPFTPRNSQLALARQ
jgi:adenylate kinase family enzyme